MKNQSAPQNDATLVCWIGDTDLLAFGKYGEDNRLPLYLRTARLVWEQDKEGSGHDFDQELSKLDIKTRNSSIILALNKARITKDPETPEYSKILLFTNRPSGNLKLLGDFRASFASFISNATNNYASNIEVIFVPSANDKTCGVDGWDYKKVYAATKEILSARIDKGENPDNYWYNITPGTIAQSTTLILVGKELSPKSNFIQVEKSRRKVYHCEIPFDINTVIDKYASSVETPAEPPIIGKTPCFLKALAKVRKIASKPVTVLITGPSGSGKEVIAREIHRLSGKPDDKFVSINCAMLSKETGVTELTGYFKGAYTGADETTPGKFELAKGGTLFLDEIGDCPAEVQAELLRFLQPLNKRNPIEREWRLKGAQPKGETKYAGVQRGDIRVIAATNRNVLDPNLFRQDLYYRIETIQIRLPSLEERKFETDIKNGIDDIKLLADAFLKDANANYITDKTQYRKFSEEAYQALREHTWTGNVRELQSVITRVVILSDNTLITKNDIIQNLNTDDLTSLSGTSSNKLTSAEKLKEIASELAREDILSGEHTIEQRIDEFKKSYCTAALRATGGNKKEAYTIIKMHPNTFKKAIER